MKINSRLELGHLLNHHGLTGLGAEIGVAYGHCTEAILDHWKGSGMFLIDPYVTQDPTQYVDLTNRINFDGALKYCREALAKHQLRTIHLRMYSDEAYKVLRGMRLDFVYIDGNHHNPQVTRDIENYWNLVKPGGILCGHDYYDLDTPEYQCDVKSSVDAFTISHDHRLFFTTPECSSWYIIK